jgi:hypothetical protein
MRSRIKVLTQLIMQIRFDDPEQEWELVNAWFVKQRNFTTRFRLRDLIQPSKGISVAEKE